ncbi:zinc-dependent alcohol dehydrogenase family protein [Aestuariibius insulae]|uniref:zinc-dependent alcohol dehydrogenase family protein n=1 Tax=Aestuariibius insulae TaxID=2058287 RepID=UPI00345E0D09
MTKSVEFTALGGPEVLTIVDRDPTPPGPGEVQVAVKAAGLNRAELLFVAGQYLVDPELPSRLGFEGAGEVLAVGDAVKRVSPGDRVAITPAFKQNGYGVLGEIINIPETALERLPDAVGWPDAAAFWMAFGTAYGLLVQTGGLIEGAGQSVVLNAASSSVGTAAFQIIRAHGGTSIATTRTRDKVEGLKAAGADHVIVTEEEDVLARVMEITANRGFDIALDAVQGEAGETLANAAGFEATMVAYGLLSGAPSMTPFYPMVAKGLRVTGFHVAWSMLDHPKRRAVAVEHLNARLADGTYKPVIDKVFPFEEIQDAYRHMASNAHLGKIVVEVAQ